MPTINTIKELKIKASEIESKLARILKVKNRDKNDDTQQEELKDIAADINQALEEAKNIKPLRENKPYKEAVSILNALRRTVSTNITNTEDRISLRKLRPANRKIELDEKNNKPVDGDLKRKLNVKIVDVTKQQNLRTAQQLNDQSNRIKTELINNKISELQAALSDMSKITVLKNTTRHIGAAIEAFSLSNKNQDDFDQLKKTCSDILSIEAGKIKKMKDPVLTRVFNALVNTMNTFLSLLDWMQSKVTGARFFRPNSPVSPAKKTLKEVNDKVVKFADALDNLKDVINFASDSLSDEIKNNKPSFK